MQFNMKIKKKYLYLAIVIATILILISIYYFAKAPEEGQKTVDESIEKEPINEWKVDKNGHISYPLDRGEIRFRRETVNDTGNILISKIIYESRNQNIYGLLVLPTSVSQLLPGVVLLPGAGVSKESELDLAIKIAELDAAVLVIDQRGIGETDGALPSLDEDYSSFLNGKEPYQHLMVYDALKGYDLLKSAPFIDPERIILAGESLGGRIAVIAAAIDRNIEGVLVISSAGFGFKGGNDTNKDLFLRSLDSDNYIDLITPRKLVMMHNVHDNVIPVSSAVSSYSKALQPKQFVLVNDTSCNHGYCDSMYNGLLDSLKYLIGVSPSDFAIKEININTTQ